MIQPAHHFQNDKYSPHKINDQILCSSKGHNKKNKRTPSINITSTPRCLKHLYCFECIQNDSSRPIENCKDCQKFFKNIKNRFFRRKTKCNLCGQKEKFQVKGCKKHNYCDFCLNFLAPNDFSYYIRINKCTECQNSIKNWKQMIAQIRSENSSKNEGTTEVSEIIEEILTSSDEKNKKNQKTSPDKKLISDKRGEEEFKEFGNCKKIRENCLSSEKGEKDEKMNLFQIPESSSYLSKPVYISYNTKNSVSYSLFKEPTCALCDGEDCVYGLLCNHNICKNCLVSHCSDEIIAFQRQPHYLEMKFFYHCPVVECCKTIDVPTSMIAKEMKKRGKDLRIDSLLQFFDGVFI